jgi:uncharacterized protein YuzE
MKSKNKNKFSYEPEADVLSWEIGGNDIDHAEEVGNVVVHFSKNNTPVLIEILQASEFLKKAKKLVSKKEKAATVGVRR